MPASRLATEYPMITGSGFVRKHAVVLAADAVRVAEHGRVQQAAIDVASCLGDQGIGQTH
jgi:hypothetical protein